ncbi:PAS domain-containing protein [Treponema phagedenis]|uniref:PAS domain-containing protein n=2 Tax=Treponema phagedenis TaxID=162 RepID=UPI0034CF271F
MFPRSKNVIGRNVANCHPRASVHIVEEIIEKFRSGEQDTAEFWINKPDLFIYIQYTAVRDSDGKFRGVLEMMQDCTHIRSLQGSQTLLTWENKKTKALPPQNQLRKNALSRARARLKPLPPTTLLPTRCSKTFWLRLPNCGTHWKINPKFKMLKTPLARIICSRRQVSAL